MHEIERTERFTLIGSEARHGKLTLFAAEGPREPGALVHVALRVSRLPEGEVFHDVAEGLRVGLVEAPTDIEYDLDHVALQVPDPEASAAAWCRLGFEPAEPRGDAVRVEAGGAFVELHRGEPPHAERPLLNHLAVLVDSADDLQTQAEAAGAAVTNVVDAENTYAVFVTGPDGVSLEYVEHKPGFSLV